MPASVPLPTTRLIGLCFAVVAVTGAWAQGERGSLTDQFPKMSAKERGRIAAKETEEASKDAGYQEQMLSGERAFQEGHYADAIGHYEAARAMRPYNVYPKVKIEDLRALLAKQAATSDTTSAVPEQPVAVDPAPVVVVDSVPTPSTPSAHATSMAVPEPPAMPPATKPALPVTGAPVTIAQPASPLKEADGLIERRYREGHAFVIERSVTVDGRLVTYKRVYHPHGQTFYFEDGLSVDERVWKARFPDR